MLTSAFCRERGRVPSLHQNPREVRDALRLPRGLTPHNYRTGKRPSRRSARHPALLDSAIAGERARVAASLARGGDCLLALPRLKAMETPMQEPRSTSGRSSSSSTTSRIRTNEEGSAPSAQAQRPCSWSSARIRMRCGPFLSLGVANGLRSGTSPGPSSARRCRPPRQVRRVTPLCRPRGPGRQR